MENSKSALKPGDLIEWIYLLRKKPVNCGEKLYSSTMKKWIPIGKPSLLISIDDETYSWMNDAGLFHARVDDTSQALLACPLRGVLPRAFVETV